MHIHYYKCFFTIRHNKKYVNIIVIKSSFDSLLFKKTLKIVINTDGNV